MDGGQLRETRSAHETLRLSVNDGCVISANEATNTLSLGPKSLQLVHTVLIFFVTLDFSVGFLYDRSKTFRNHTHRRKLN